MDDRARAAEIVGILEGLYPMERGTVLRWGNPLELLVSTILSAQSTDSQVNKITPELFARYRTARDYAEAQVEELEGYVRSSGFYHRKAELIRRACRMIVDEFGGEVPGTMEGLLRLHGVARKTANIVLQNAFGVSEGVAVDTHVMRLSGRLGLTGEKDRDKIERDLMALLPREKWAPLNYLLITHGRRVCDAKKPLCDRCRLSGLCPSAFQFRHFKK